MVINKVAGLVLIEAICNVSMIFFKVNATLWHDIHVCCYNVLWLPGLRLTVLFNVRYRVVSNQELMRKWALIWTDWSRVHYSDVIMSAMASQITGISIICWTVCSGVDHTIHQSSAPLASVRGIHRWSTDGFPSQRACSGKMFPFDDVIMD